MHTNRYNHLLLLLNKNHAGKKEGMVAAHCKRGDCLQTCADTFEFRLILLAHQFSDGKMTHRMKDLFFLNRAPVNGTVETARNRNRQICLNNEQTN